MEPYLLDSLIKIMDFHQRKKNRRGRKVVEDALQYIDQEIFSPDLSLNTAAAKIYSNESYLSRVFKKEMGISLMEFILKKRIEESIRLLNSTDMKVYEIAEKIGFRDPHYFSICFKKITGVTVKEFKKLKVST
jgi:two-component system response regulator YesN